MGGTFSEGAGAARSPLEAAALGSAIIHGPRTAPFDAEYARLDDARAARAVLRPTRLGDAVADLMAPDRAAILAHNAWAVTSGGAGAAEAVARAILSELDSRTTGAQ
jgi:3-deoxy-D-manno-octulosonic-acid transferase